MQALDQTGAAYGKAAGAAGRKDKAGFRKAGSAVADGEKAIAGALAGLKAAGYDVAS